MINTTYVFASKGTHTTIKLKSSLTSTNLIYSNSALEEKKIGLTKGPFLHDWMNMKICNSKHVLFLLFLLLILLAWRNLLDALELSHLRSISHKPIEGRDHMMYGWEEGCIPLWKFPLSTMLWRSQSTEWMTSGIHETKPLDVIIFDQVLV